jgi:hypothetical protein
MFHFPTMLDNPTLRFTNTVYNEQKNINVEYQ